MKQNPASIELSFHPPFDWQALTGFLGARSIAGVEEVNASTYRRIVRLEHDGEPHTGWVELTPHKRRAVLRVAVSDSLSGALPAVLLRLSHLMDVSCNPKEVAVTLGALAAARPGLRVPGAFDGFEIAVRAILGQQVSVVAARTLAGRFAAAFGVLVDSPFAQLSRAFPAPELIAEMDVADISGLGVLPSRARTIVDLAKVLACGDLCLAPGVDVPATLDKLRSIRGIGEWTAQYVAMRALAWPDAFPHTDLGVMKALGEKNPRKVLEAGEAWRPWRAYAVMHLWARLGPASRGGKRGESQGSSALRRGPPGVPG